MCVCVCVCVCVWCSTLKHDAATIDVDDLPFPSIALLKTSNVRVLTSTVVLGCYASCTAERYRRTDLG